MATATRLKVGDIVSAAVRSFGKEYAISRGAHPWTSESVRDEAKVVGKDGVNWTVVFNDGEGPVVLVRKVLRFVRREESAPDGTTRYNA
eukprot:3585476-Pleurochrysis_carterae.AAC.1